MDEPLRHQVALITGAASGIGRATALALAAAGTSVAAVDRDADSISRVVAEAEQAGLAVTAFSADLSDVGLIPSLVSRVLAAMGKVDILVNCAGVSGVIGASQRITDVTDDTYETVMTVNLHAPFALTREVGRHMVERAAGGRIVNVSSSAAFQGLGVPAVYAASKAGINALTRVSAAELAPHGINVNAVAPGVTRTPIIGEGLTDTDYDALVSSGPLENFTHRAADPGEVAGVIRFLCLDDSAQITGQVIHTSAGGIV
jgi:NAD(P)-dependent dehydrogenase (short-subunit alcohol dehydrogenase family)